MSDEKALVQRAYKAFQRGDIAAVLDSLSDGIVWENPSVVGAPYGGRVVGKAAVAEFFRKLDEALEFEHFEPREFIGEGDRVVAIIGHRGRVRATGRTAEMDLIHIFTVHDGKVTQFLEFFDTAIAERAFAHSASA
jgi:ketosteroid isomerase-like protein